MKDVLMGSIMKDTFGVGAKKKIATLRIDILAGNVKSYDRCLNSEAQLIELRDMNELAATLGEIQAHKDDAKETRSEERKQKDTDKLLRKAADTAAERHKKDELLPELKEDVNKGLAHVLSLINERLKQVLSYCFDRPPKSSVSKHVLQDAIRECWGEEALPSLLPE